MTPELRKKWVAALRSGEYKQCESLLNDGFGGYCCLGVLCSITGYTFNGNSYEGDRVFPNEAKLKDWGLSHYMANKFAVMNDQGKTFEDIAAVITKKGKRL